MDQPELFTTWARWPYVRTEGTVKEYPIVLPKVAAHEELQATALTNPSVHDRVPVQPGQPREPGQRGTLDVELLLLCALLAGAVVWFQGPMVLRVPAGLLAILFFPGYGLVVAMFPRTDEFETIEWLALAIGVSLALVPIVALVLVYTSWGIRLSPIVVAETTCTLVAGTIGWYRRRQSGSPSFGLIERVSPALVGRHVSRLPLILVGGGLVVAIVAFVLSVALPTPPPTAFYALGSTGLADNYPFEATAGQDISLDVGIASHDGAAVTYRIDTVFNDEILQSSAPVQVQPGGTWQGSITFPAPSQPGGDQEVQVNLVKDGKTYRQLRFWLKVQAAGQGGI